MLLWLVSGGVLTLVAMLATRPTSRRALLVPPPVLRDSGRADLEIAVLIAVTLLVTPIVWPHYYVVLVMPVALVAVSLYRQVIGARDRRQRVGPVLALAALAIGTAALSTAHYVEPYAGVGGQQLLALLLVFGASLVALRCASRTQGVGPSPALAR
jgi:hypothetical protein